MEKFDRFEEFSLLGGPLHWLGCRLGLVRNSANTFWLGMALGLSAWSVLMVLALLQGAGHKLFSLALIGAHVRFLAAVPLFFLCETTVVPRMAEFVGNIVRSEVVPKSSLPALESEIARVGRWKDSWLAEVICLLLAVLMPLIWTQLHLAGAMAIYDQTTAVGTLAGHWYWFVCLPLFRFLMFRWFWRLGLWWYVLRRVAKMELHLVPIHPDGAAGLGYLEVVHTHFTPMVLALSSVLSATFAEELSSGTMTAATVYPAIALSLVLFTAFFLGPLFLFALKLWNCRVKGMNDYMEFASHYVNGFERKWLGADESQQQHLLGTSDLQALSALSDSVNIVRTMRWVPLSPLLVTNLAIAALLPLLPLLLLKYPVTELFEKIVRRLVGL